MVSFSEVFSVKKPIIGMIHLAGHTASEKLDRAIEELRIYNEEGADGAIIEDYHGEPEDVVNALKESKRGFSIQRGVNLLRDPYRAFALAFAYGASFIQFDSVQTLDLEQKIYRRCRQTCDNIAVLGGVGFKYTRPTGRPLEVDLAEGKSRCEAIVTTGTGTGIETPLDKLRQYKKVLGDFPLIVGAGVNANNIQAQLAVADGAIIGSYFKLGGNTHFPVERSRVRSLMDIVRQIRDSKS